MLYGKQLKKLELRKVYKNHLGLEFQDLLLYNKDVMDRRNTNMKEFKLIEKVVMTRVITVEAESIEEVEANYENGDYDEELESCYFDGQYDDREIEVKEK